MCARVCNCFRLSIVVLYWLGLRSQAHHWLNFKFFKFKIYKKLKFSRKHSWKFRSCRKNWESRLTRTGKNRRSWSTGFSTTSWSIAVWWDLRDDISIAMATPTFSRWSTNARKRFSIRCFSSCRLSQRMPCSSGRRRRWSSCIQALCS